MALNFDFNKSIDVDEIKELFTYYDKGTNQKHPLLSMELCFSESAKKQVIKVRGIFFGYENVWVNSYSEPCNYFEIVCRIKKLDAIEIKSYLLDCKCKNELVDRINRDAEFGKEDKTEIIIPNYNCNDKTHYHYPLYAEKTFTKFKDVGSSHNKWNEKLEFRTKNENISVVKERNSHGQISLRLKYFTSYEDNSELKKYVYKNPYTYGQHVRELYLGYTETLIFELVLNKKEEVLGFNYCGEGFFPGYWDGAIKSLSFCKNYEQSLKDLTIQELMSTDEYLINLEIGKKIYDTIKN